MIWMVWLLDCFICLTLWKKTIKLKLLKLPQLQSLVEEEEEVGTYKKDVVVALDILNAYIARELVITKKFVIFPDKSVIVGPKRDFHQFCSWTWEYSPGKPCNANNMKKVWLLWSLIMMITWMTQIDKWSLKSWMWSKEDQTTIIVGAEGNTKFCS